jgi:hypothetical protein
LSEKFQLIISINGHNYSQISHHLKIKNEDKNQLTFIIFIAKDKILNAGYSGKTKTKVQIK